MLNKRAGCHLFLAVFLLPLLSFAQNPESILGDHAITLDLKPLSADRVIALLSQRARSISTETNWEATGLEQLQGIIIDVDFSQVPVHEVVTEVLGCSGFTYVEHGNRIVIEPLRQPFPRRRCAHVIIDPIAMNDSALPSKHRTYTYLFEQISTADFIARFSQDSGLNFLLADSDIDLNEVNIRVDMTAMPEPMVVRKLFHCIGWSYQHEGKIVRATDQVQLATTDSCREVEQVR